MRNKIITTVAAILCLVLFAACGQRQESAGAAGEQAMKQYVDENFGGAEYIKMEEGDGAVKYYFADEQYGFTFWTKNLMEPVSMDDEALGYSEVKEDNYEEAYYQSIKTLILDEVEKLEQEYAFTTEWNIVIRSAKFAKLHFTEKAESNEEAIEKFALLVVTYDARNSYDSLGIYVGETSEGSYLIRENRFMSQDELDREEALLYAREICEKPVKYQHCEVRKVRDVPGVSELDEEADSYYYGEAQQRADENTVVYFFEVDGEVYSVANLYGREAQLTKWFCNYRK